MHYVYHPNSDKERNNVFVRMHGLIFTTKGKTNEEACKIFLPATLDHLFVFAPVFITAYNHRNLAISTCNNVTGQKKVLKKAAKKIISHYFHSLKNGIKRGIFKSSDRNLYGLNAGNNNIPLMISERDILHWGALIIDGEAARVAQGGLPLSMPSVEEVKTVLDNFKNIQKLQSERKMDLVKEQKKIRELHAEADELITELWDEVEFYIRKSERAARRLQCSQWGIIYKTRYRNIKQNNDTQQK